jgi:tRNA threonylcarbamoyl adenosine modification protein (Sua5/YciO/YrdC/YwlC family)
VVVDEHGAVDHLARGEVIVIPTDTVYGVAVAAHVPGATDALFALKQRPTDVALPVLIADPMDAGAYALFSDEGRTLAEEHWPGALTLVGTRTALSEGWDLGGDATTVGLRCPDDMQIRRIAAAIGPLVTTSANLHGQPPCTTVAEVVAALGPDIPVLDGGTRDAQPSTVVDATTSKLRILRAGAVAIA